MADRQCDVCCRKDELFNVSSRMAPITYSICKACEGRGAENIGVVTLWIAGYGGPGLAPDFVTQLVSWIDGEYVGWEQIGRYFIANETGIRQAFEEEFLLVDDDQ